MRIWNLPPFFMCGKHLRGEHVECHMFVGSLTAGKSFKGYVEDKLVDTSLIKARHDELAEEMVARGGNHNSPLEMPELSEHVGGVDPRANLLELARRCPDCRERIEQRINLTNFSDMLPQIKALPEGGDGVVDEGDQFVARYSGEVIYRSYTKGPALKALENHRKSVR